MKSLACCARAFVQGLHVRRAPVTAVMRVKPGPSVRGQVAILPLNSSTCASHSIHNRLHPGTPIPTRFPETAAQHTLLSRSCTRCSPSPTWAHVSRSIPTPPEAFPSCPHPEQLQARCESQWQTALQPCAQRSLGVCMRLLTPLSTPYSPALFTLLLAAGTPHGEPLQPYRRPPCLPPGPSGCIDHRLQPRVWPHHHTPRSPPQWHRGPCTFAGGATVPV